MTTHHTRRSVLTAAGASALTFGTLGVVAQESVETTYRLAMTEDGWVGQAPESISDTASPTLQMEPGQSYRVAVDNQTQERHNLVLSGRYPTGTTLVRTKFADPGESLEVTFTAQRGLSAYFCEQHLEEVGPIAVGGDAAQVDDATATAANDTGPELNTTGNIPGIPGNVSGNASIVPANVTNLVNDTNVTANTTDGGDLAGTSPEPAQTFKFVGTVPGWIATAPQEIQGETNPTLDLTVGETYDFIWVNGDGAPHNLIVETDDDEQLLRSDQIAKGGSWQTIRFVATGRMHQYYCQFHPIGMRGDVALNGGEETSEDGNDTSNQTTATK